MTYLWGGEKGLVLEKLFCSLKLFHSLLLTITQHFMVLKGCIIPLLSTLCEILKALSLFDPLVFWSLGVNTLKLKLGICSRQKLFSPGIDVTSLNLPYSWLDKRTGKMCDCNSVCKISGTGVFALFFFYFKKNQEFWLNIAVIYQKYRFAVFCSDLRLSTQFFPFNKDKRDSINVTVP